MSDVILVCRCCGRRTKPHPRSTTTCTVCVVECTNEGCVNNWVRVLPEEQQQ